MVVTPIFAVTFVVSFRAGANPDPIKVEPDILADPVTVKLLVKIELPSSNTTNEADPFVFSTRNAVVALVAPFPLIWTKDVLDLAPTLAKPVKVVKKADGPEAECHHA